MSVGRTEVDRRFKNWMEETGPCKLGWRGLALTKRATSSSKTAGQDRKGRGRLEEKGDGGHFMLFP